MDVDRVKVSLKYSQLLASGNTKTVELEAEGTVSPKETWQQAQTYLYAELEKQVMEVFKLPEAKLEASTIHPAPTPTPPPPMRDPNDPEGIFQQRPPARMEQPMGGQLPTSEAPIHLHREQAQQWLDSQGIPEAERGRYQQQPAGGPLHHWCVRHAAQFHQHTKNGANWWSHKVEGTEEWCREE